MARQVESSFVRNRLGMLLFLFLGVIIFGTIGYMLLEGWTVTDALYMTVITLTTVGFGETYPLSQTGRLFTIALIATGVSIVAYSSTTVVQMLVTGELRTLLAFEWRQRMLEKLRDHYIVCGYGRMGRNVAEELAKRNMPFVIIDRSEEVVENCRQHGYVTLLGNAANDEVLKRAGIYRAKSLIATAPSDAENVFIVLTARELCPSLTIVSRMNYDDSESKLRRAGANEVISPYDIGGKRMVSYVERPGVVDFLDVVMHSQDLELQLEEFVVDQQSGLAGKSLQELRLRSEVGVNIMAMRLPGQKLSAHLDTEVPLEPGTHLIALGTGEQLEALSRLARAVQAR